MKRRPATLPFEAAPDESAPQRPSGAPPRDRRSPAAESPPRPAIAPPTAYAIGSWDEGTARMVYLSRSALGSNLMSTLDPLFARTWQSPELARAWAEEQAESVRSQLDARPRLILPVSATVGEAVGSLPVAAPAGAVEVAA